MCESAVYYRDGKGERLVSDEVGRIDVRGEQVTVAPVLGPPVVLRARVLAIDLLGHRITLVDPQTADEPASRILRP